MSARDELAKLLRAVHGMPFDQAAHAIVEQGWQPPARDAPRDKCDHDWIENYGYEFCHKCGVGKEAAGVKVEK